MKKGRIERGRYIEEKRRHEELCGEKQKKEREEKDQKKIMEITDETEIGKYIKKKRGKREGLEESIKREQWKEHFHGTIRRQRYKDKATRARRRTRREGRRGRRNAIILEGKLRKEVENLKIIPETQAGFRKRRGCIDNIYALKVAAEKAMAKKNGRLIRLLCGFKGCLRQGRQEAVMENIKRIRDK